MRPNSSHYAALRDLLLEKSDQTPKVAGLHDGMSGLLAKTSPSGIPARNGTDAGKGKCFLCMINNGGKIVETSTEVSVFNPFSSAIESDTYITVKVINGAQLVVDAEDRG